MAFCSHDHKKLCHSLQVNVILFNMSNKWRHKKERMFKESQNCRRCGVLMWLPPSGDGRATKHLTEEQHNTMATIGHKYSKLDERRHTEPGANKKYELICHKCNHNESNEELSKLPIEKQWEMSKAYPKDHPMALKNELNKYNNMNTEKIKKLWEEAEKYSQGLPEEERSVSRTVGFYDCLNRKINSDMQYTGASQGKPDSSEPNPKITADNQVNTNKKS